MDEVVGKVQRSGRKASVTYISRDRGRLFISGSRKRYSNDRSGAFEHQSQLKARRIDRVIYGLSEEMCLPLVLHFP